MRTADRVKTILADADLLRTNHRRVAETLHISSSTLVRRLQAEGITFQELVDAERMRRCEVALEVNPETRGHRLAELCGYTERNSFYRAFIRWYGESFSDYRRARYV